MIYGIELARTGELKNIACANHLWWNSLEPISREPLDSWKAYEEKFGGQFDELRKELRKTAPILKRFGGMSHMSQRAARMA